MSVGDRFFLSVSYHPVSLAAVTTRALGLVSERALTRAVRTDPTSPESFEICIRRPSGEEPRERVSGKVEKSDSEN